MQTSRRSAMVLGSAAAAGTFATPTASRAQGAGEAQASPRPTHFRVPFGQLEITALLDGQLEFDGPHPIFGQDQEAEAVHELARANFLPPRTMQIQFTPILVDTGDELVLFDAGNPASRAPAAANLPDVMQAAGHAVEDVTLVVITHFHPDHIGGLMRDGSPTFPNARYLTSQTELEFWTSDAAQSGPTQSGAQLVQENVVPLRDKLEFIADGQEAAPGITAIEAFGHTPGHMAFHIESDGKRLLNWADTSNHYVLSVQRPEWHVRFDMDKEAATATRKRILDMAASERIPVTGYHMPFPALGFIDRRGEVHHWVPMSYTIQL